MAQVAFSTCDLCDANEQDATGAFRILPPVFRDFGVVRPFYGAVQTVRALEDNSRVRELVNTPGQGRVLVVDGGGSLRRALMGGNVALAAAKSGWAGVVIDGAVRDAAELREAGIPIRALALCPMRTQKHGAGQTGESVRIQGVHVQAGDWLYADEDGIVLSRQPLLQG